MAGLAVRLYLGGAGAPRRYFAWGQAVRRAVLAVLLVHAVLAADILVFLERGRRLAGWLPPPPASLAVAPGGGWDMAYYLVSVAWIAVFVTLALGYYRPARVMAAPAIVPGLAALIQAQLTGIMPAPFAAWPFWVLLDLAPVLAMTAFHRNAPPAAPLPGLRPCPPATSWCTGRCWRSRRPATPPGCRTSPGCAASWSAWPASRTHPGPGPARPAAPGPGR